MASSKDNVTCHLCPVGVFGEPRPTAPYAAVTSTDLTYTGQRDLPGTGLMDYKARFYSPALKRFIQPDSIMPGMRSQSGNRYSYVLNNPINANDPSGHKCVGEPDECLKDNGKKGAGLTGTGAKGDYVRPSSSGGNGGGSNNKDNDKRRRHTDSHEGDVEEPDNLDLSYFLLENNPDFNPFFAGTSNHTYDEYFNSGAFDIDLAFLDLYGQLGVDIDFYAERGMHNPVNVNQVPSEIQYRLVGPAQSIEIQYFLMEMDLLTPGISMNHEPNYLFSLMIYHPLALKNAIDKFNVEIAPLTEHLKDVGPGTGND